MEICASRPALNAVSGPVGNTQDGAACEREEVPGNPFWVLDLLGMLKHWFWRLDAQGSVTWVSDGFNRLAGAKPEVLLGHTLPALADPAEPEGDAEGIQAAIAHRRPFSALAHSLALGLDRTIWVRTSGRPHHALDGTFLGYRCVSEDISDLVRKERAWRDIARQNRLLAAAIDATQVGVVVVDATLPGHPLIYVNDAFTRATGWSLSAAIGQGLEILFGEESDPDATARIRSALAEGQPCTVALAARRWDGSAFWSDLALAPVHSGLRVTAMVGILTDITRRREEETRRQEGQRLEALGHLAGGMAHEINNLLQPVVTFTELAMAAVPAGEEPLQRYLPRVLSAALKAREVVRNVLFFARRSGTTTEELELRRTVDDAVRFVSDMLPSTVAVQRSGLDPGQEEDHGTAHFNAVEMTQVAANLMMNAAQAMGGRGNIRVSLESLWIDAEQARRLGASPGHYARVSVGDHGPGMDQETLLRVFEPFFTTKPLGEGTGLGLSVVYGIVRNWKGVVDVESILGRGTRFDVYIPRSR